MPAAAFPPQQLKFGYYASLLFALFTLITWGLAMMAVPPSGPYCPGDCMTYPFSDILSYFPRDYYWMYLAVFQLFAYLIFMISNHFFAPLEKKLYSSIGVGFSLIAAIVLLIAYYTQFAVVPLSVMKGETEGIALLTQYNGHGIFIAMEELGYIAMSISFLFLAPVFSKKKGLEIAIRRILWVPFVFTLLAFVLYTLKFGIDRDYRFEVAAITINWLVSIAVGILIGICMRRKMKAAGT
jgi:hypothetical protein